MIFTQARGMESAFRLRGDPMAFDEFYRETFVPRHPPGVCRVLHLLGAPVSALLFAVIVAIGNWWLLVLVPLPGYLLGSLGHLLAGNRPTFFEHPWWSFKGLFRLNGQVLRGRQPLLNRTSGSHGDAMSSPDPKHQTSASVPTA